MTKRTKFTESHDSAARKSSSQTATGSRKNTLIDPFAIYTTESCRVLEGRPSLPGSLWLCYHALKLSEWKDTHDREHHCAYCSQMELAGHEDDCMIGNALRMVANAVPPGTPDYISGTSTLRVPWDLPDFPEKRPKPKK